MTDLLRYPGLSQVVANSKADGAYAPVDIVAAINGADTIELNGFGRLAMPRSWVRPGVKFVDARNFALASKASALLKSHNKKIARLRYLSAFFLIVGGVCGGLMVPGLYKAHYATATSEVVQWREWSVKQVLSKGVQVEVKAFGSSPSELNFVPIGQKLPDGQVVRLTYPEGAQFATNVGIHKLVHPMQTPEVRSSSASEMEQEIKILLSKSSAALVKENSNQDPMESSLTSSLGTDGGKALSSAPSIPGP